MITVAVSGGFDPIHVGHIELIRAARELGDRLVVVLNSDEWLLRKKGFRFLPWTDRAYLVSLYGFVDGILPVNDSDGTVCEALRWLRPTVFANGGDRTVGNTPERVLCEELGIRMAWNVGGPKIDSSTVIAARRRVERDWGTYEVLHDVPGLRVKAIEIAPHAQMRRQRHARRTEHWFYEDGRVQHVPAGAWHRFENPTGCPVRLIEVQVGTPEEADVEREA